MPGAVWSQTRPLPPFGAVGFGGESVDVLVVYWRARCAWIADRASTKDRDEPDKPSLNIVAVLSWLLAARLTGPGQATGSYPCLVSISAILAFPSSDGCV